MRCIWVKYKVLCLHNELRKSSQRYDTTLFFSKTFFFKKNVFENMNDFEKIDRVLLRRHVNSSEKFMGDIWMSCQRHLPCKI